MSADLAWRLGSGQSDPATPPFAPMSPAAEGEISGAVEFSLEKAVHMCTASTQPHAKHGGTASSVPYDHRNMKLCAYRRMQWVS
jgi:hypothetical protein